MVFTKDFDASIPGPTGWDPYEDNSDEQEFFFQQPGQKRPYNATTIGQRATIMEDFRKDPNSTKVAKKRGVKRTTVVEIVKHQEKIKQAIKDGYDPKRKRFRKAKYPKLEETLLRWFRDIKKKSPISGELIQGQALKIAKSMGIVNFSASNGWLERFKNRHSLRMKSAHGEAGEISQAMKDNFEVWKINCMYPIFELYPPSDRYNIDETALFYEALPKKTMAFRNEVIAGLKQSKARVTLLVGSNMDGSDKLPLLMIGKFEKPRCFKHVTKLPIFYASSRNAWMTSEIFERYMTSWDKYLQSLDLHCWDRHPCQAELARRL